MKQFSRIKILLLSLLLIFSTLSVFTNLTLFLTQQQTWLFFPHRYPLNTYTAQCQLNSNNHTSQHPQLQTIAYFEYNNTCTSIDILSDSSQKQSIFYFAKLLPEECTIYQVRQEKISVYYRYRTNHVFQSVLMLNQFNTLVWNDQKMMRIQYSLISNEVNAYELPLDSLPVRTCSKNTPKSAFCWNDKQFIVYNFTQQGLQVNVTNFAPQSQYQIKTILPLQTEQNIYLICQSIICNVSKISKGQITTIMTYNFVLRILGGAVYPETNSMMIVNQQHLNIYTYVLFSQIEIKFEQSIEFPQQFECVNFDHSVFAKDLIIIECFNFLGQQQKLVLVRDTQANSYVPYNPFVNQITQDCWLGGNSLNLFTLCTNQITIKNTNFYYLQLDTDFPSSQSKQTSFNLTLECTNFDETQQKQQQIFKIQIKKCDLGQTYFDQLVPVHNQMSYSGVKQLRLRDYFKGSNIVDYRIESDCQFIQPLEYQPIQYISYFSLYNRQKCVQIVSGGGDLFYRLIQVNSTVFYMEQCHLNKIGYGCQLCQIFQGSESLRLGLYDFQLIKFFIVEGNLEANYENVTKKIFDHKVEQLQILDNIIRIKTKTSFYTNTVENVINNCGEWVGEERTKRYFYEGSTTLQLNQDGVIRQYQHGILQSQTLFPSLAFNHSQLQYQQNDTIIKLPYILKKSYYFFIISQNYITKFYHREKVIHIYSLPYNSQNYSITDITLTDIYLTIQYQFGIFQIYDIEQETVSAKIITISQTIMTDVILLAQDVLLIPIQSETTLIKIQRNPILSMGSFTPAYSRFLETCRFRLKVSVQNDSCPVSFHKQDKQQLSCVQDEQQQIFQQFYIKILYNVQQINLGITVETQLQPTYCQNCWLDLNQFQFQGPIFAYQLNDDYFEQFILIPHLELATCSEKQSLLLKNMSEIRFEGDSSSNQVLMTDGNFIYLMDTSLSIKNQYILEDTHFCSSYVKLQQKYLILCDRYLLLLHQNQTLISFRHNLNILPSNRHDLQLQYQKLENSDFFIYILDHDITIHIYKFEQNQQTIKHIDNYVFNSAIEDMKVVDNRIIILKINHLCLAQRNNQTNHTLFFDSMNTASRNCYDLANVVPKGYTSNNWFQQIIPYYSNSTIIKALLISKNESNLHIDLTIQLTQYPIDFITTNVYAGYPGFQFYDFISINLTDDSYSNFIILYQDEIKKNSCFLLAYYPYNYGFEGDRIIGQIKTAHFLQNYFSKPYNFSFLAFEESMFITHHSGSLKSHLQILNASLPKQNKECLFISVNPKLQIKLSYNQTPPIKFLIVRANNHNSIDSHFIRLHFTEENQSLEISLIGFAVTVVLFIILVVATNRCKSNQSDIQVHFMRDQDEIDQPSYEPSISKQQSSLLHSKGSSQFASDQYYNGQDDYQEGQNEIVMIRQQ